jgi:hypothetical protein
MQNSIINEQKTIDCIKWLHNPIFDAQTSNLELFHHTLAISTNSYTFAAID